MNRSLFGWTLNTTIAFLPLITSIGVTAGEAPMPPQTPTGAASPVSKPVASPQPVKLGPVVVTGSVRTRFESWDWFTPDSGDPSYGFSGTIIRLGFAQSREQLDWMVELGAPILLGLPDNAVAPGTQGALGAGANYALANKRNTNAAMIFPKQGFIRFKGLFGDGSQSLRLGRFEFIDGTEITPKNATLAAVKRERVAARLIGNFVWTHGQRSIDGFQYVSNKKKLNFNLTGALPDRGVFQVDGWGPLEVGFVNASLNGGYAKGSVSADWRAFAIYYHDWRHILKTDNRALASRRNDLANIRIGTFGGHYLVTGETQAGPLDLLLWGALQSGKWGVNDHAAHAAVVEGGWQPRVLPRLRPWIRAGYNLGSGDSDPNDAKHGTFFQLLPTPRPFARFPFFNMMNNQQLYSGLTVRPHKQVSLKSEVSSLRLAQGNDLWYQGGGAFQPWSFGYIGRAVSGKRGLATLYDLSVDYNVNSHWNLNAYYGYAAGHSAISGIYPKGTTGSLGYVELGYKF